MDYVGAVMLKPLAGNAKSTATAKNQLAMSDGKAGKKPKVELDE